MKNTNIIHACRQSGKTVTTYNTLINYVKGRQMRRKNRQFKITVDVPEEFESDEEFAYALQDTMDSTNWTITVEDEDGKKVGCPVSKVHYADFELVEEKE